MKKLRLLTIVVLLFAFYNCDKNTTEPESDKKELITSGIWQIAADSEVGQVGVQIQYFKDGTAKVRENSTSNWYPDVLTWTLSADGKILTINGTDGPGTMDKVEILEISTSLCRSKIIDSTSPSAIGKILKMVKVQG